MLSEGSRRPLRPGMAILVIAALLGGCLFDPSGLGLPDDGDAAPPSDATLDDAGGRPAPPLGVAIPEIPGVLPAQTVNQATASEARVVVMLSTASTSLDLAHLRVFVPGAGLVEPAPLPVLPGGGQVAFTLSVAALPDGPLNLEAWTSRQHGDRSTAVRSVAMKDTLLFLEVDPLVTPSAAGEHLVSGLTEPGAALEVTSAALSEPVVGTADAHGFFVLHASLPEGLHSLRVEATDAATNRLAKETDRQGGGLLLRRLPSDGPVQLRNESAARIPLPPSSTVCPEGAGATFTFLGEPDLSEAALVPDIFVTCLNLGFVNDGTGHFELLDLGGAISGQRAVVAGDFDNDGDWDLALTRSAGGNAVFLYRNLLRPHAGQGFDNASALLGHSAANPEGLAWLDADGDGWLDLFLQDGSVNVLLMNNGAGLGFANESVARGLGALAGLDNGHWVTASDFDQDGDVDLVVADDTGPGYLLVNQGGHFVDRSSDLGLDFTQTGKWGLVFGDMGSKGVFDLFVAQGGTGGTNALLTFTPGTGFKDVATEAGVATPGAAGGAAWGDLDQNGHLDLVYYLAPSGGTMTLVQKLNAGDRDSDGVPDFDTHTLDFSVEGTFAPAGLLLADVDNDGDLDVLVVDRGGSHLLLINTLTDPQGPGEPRQNPRFLRVLLVGNGVTSNRSALGAVVRARPCTGGAFFGTREVSGGEGTGGQASPVLHFGGILPSACVEVEARFVGGQPVQVKVRPALLPNQTLVIFQP